MDFNEQNYGTGNRVPASCTIQEFRKKYASEGLRKNIKTWCIVAYVMCGINLLLALFVNIFALVDFALLLGLTLGLHINKSKGCAIGILVYAIIGCVLSLVGGGSVTGVYWIAMGVASLGIFKKMDAEYQNAMASATQYIDGYNY